VLRAEKAKVIDDLHAAFNNAGVVVVTHYKGLSVPEVTEFRVEMRKAGATFRVAKNRLAMRAAEGTPYAGVVKLFKGPTALAFSGDAVAAAKVATAFAKKNDKLQIIGGGLAGALLDPAAVKELAELPSLDELRGKLVGLLQAPAAKLIAVLQAPGAQVARCLGARGEQGEASQPADEA
jgi:large subunit ribosomal protein L10